MARRKSKQKEEPKVEEQVVNGEDTLLGEAQVVDELPADVKLLRREVTRLRNKLQSAEAGTDVIVDAIKEVFAEVMDPKAYGRPIKTPPASKKKHEETALLHLTDLHFGKVTPLFSSEIATERIESIAHKVLKITEVRRAAASLDEIVVFIGGDDIQSEVVPGGVLHIDEGVFEQACYTCPEALLRLILFLAQHYRKVRVYGVPGNHGRPFPSRKTPKGPRTNWDLVCLRVLEVMLMGPDGSDPWGLKGRVEFCEIGHWYQLARIYDWGALLVHGDQIRGGFAGFPWYGACVPTDHEILTRTGWKAVDQLQVGEDILGYDHGSGTSRWEPLEAVNLFDFDGDLYSIERPGGYSIRCTPNHRWPTHGWNGRRAWKTADEINTSDWLPIHGRLDHNRSVLSPRHAAILGWVVTDGHGRWTGNHWEAVVYQSPKKYLATVEELLGHRARPLAPSQIARGEDVQAVPVSLEDARAITTVYRSKEDLPRLVGLLSTEAAEAMLEAMELAESHERGRSRKFTQKTGPVAEAFSMLSVLVGRTAWRCQDSEIERWFTRTGQRIRPGWGSGMQRVPYQGKVWCPTTPSSGWWVRHGGMIMPTGNSKKMGGWADVVPAMESIYGVDGRWDHVYFGHFHQHVSGPAGARRWFATGSLESFDPYAAEELASWGPASQRMNIYDPDIGVIAEMPLYVEPVRPVTRAHEPLGEIPVGPRWHGK